MANLLVGSVFSFWTRTTVTEDEARRRKAWWANRYRWQSPPPMAYASLKGAVNADMVKRLEAVLAADEMAPVYVVIDTEGGDCAAALAIYDMLRSRFGPVSAQVERDCLSAGIVCLLGADHRSASPGARFMV